GFRIWVWCLAAVGGVRAIGRRGGGRDTVTSLARRLQRYGTPVSDIRIARGYFWVAAGALAASGGVLMVVVVFWWWWAVFAVAEAGQGLPELGAPPSMSGSLPELR
ncbi:hypothetical protein Dimus_007520, partial [Dionaea muscipula]